MCSLEHNEEGIFSQNIIAKFGVQALQVFKYKYYINVLEMKNELLKMD